MLRPIFPTRARGTSCLADTKTTRRSCSSVGIRPLEIAAPVLFGLLVIRRALFKRNPICGFEDDRLCGRAGPHIRRFDELHDEKRSSILALPLHALACMDRELYLKAAVQVRCFFSSRTPAMRGRSRGSGGRIVRPLLLFGLLRVHVRRYYRVLLPLRVGTFEFQWT